MSPPPFNDSNPYNVGDDVNPKPPNLNPKTLTLYLSQALEASLTLNPQTLNPYTPKLLVVVIRDPNQGPPRFLNQVPTLYYRRFAWCVPPPFLELRFDRSAAQNLGLFLGPLLLRWSCQEQV